ncbi:hypothetical protein PFISCL1PPCAC_14839, partial [Pristionchus fissidentatus]
EGERVGRRDGERGGEGWGQTGGGRQYDNRSPYNSRAQSMKSGGWGEEGVGFGFGPPSHSDRMNVPLDRGLIVLYSTKSSIIYTTNRQLVDFVGDIHKRNQRLGDTVEFEMVPTPPGAHLPFKVCDGTLRAVEPLRLEFTVHEQELYVHTYGTLNANRSIFSTRDVSDVRIDGSRMGSDLRTYNRNYIDKNRFIVGHEYEIYVKFCGEEFCWVFSCVDDSSPVYQLEQEDEIAQYKRRMREEEEKEKRLEREGRMSNREESWEKIDGSPYASSRASSSSAQRPVHSSNDNRSKYSVPSRLPSKAPSVASVSTQRTFTTTTMTETETGDKEMKNLRKELDQVKLMLKSVWEYKEVQKIVKQNNYFLYQMTDDWAVAEQEEKSEQRN